MSSESRDLIVLGSGPGGYVAAIRAAQLGRKVSIVERESLGGVCLNWGCIPSKALLTSAGLYQHMLHSAGFGVEADNVRHDYGKIIERSRSVAAKLSAGVAHLMKKNSIEVVKGTGRLRNGNELSIMREGGSEEILPFKDIIIATGAKPKMIPGIEADGVHIHTSRTLLDSRTQPGKILIIGAGAIGIEFAYFLHSLGSDVTVAEMLDQILPYEDTEVARSLENILGRRGMAIHTRASVQGLRVEEGRVRATIKKESGEEQWEGDACLVAVGVTPNTEGIGIEEVGIELDRGFIKVDSFLRTNVAHHFAIGDAAGQPLLAHKASHEGLIAAESACGVAENGMNYTNIAACTYCQPQVASVGLTERAVKEKGIPYKTGKVPFMAIGKAIAAGESDGFIKVIIDSELGEVLGVHILHAEATELISEAAVIRSHEGIASSVIETIHPHPTASEAIAEAMALALGRPINI